MPRSRDEEITRSQLIAPSISGGRQGGRSFKITESMRIIAPGVTHRQRQPIVVRGSEAITEYEDLFAGSSSYGFGDDWSMLTRHPLANFVETHHLDGSGNARFLGSTSGGNNDDPIVWSPLSACSHFWGLNQFAEFVFDANTSASGTLLMWAGVAVMAGTQGGGMKAYTLSSTVGAGGTNNRSWIVHRQVNATATSILASSTASHQYAAGDTLRLEVIIGASQNDLEVFINDVSQGTVSDNNATRPTTGVPGMARARRVGTGNGLACTLRSAKIGVL